MTKPFYNQELNFNANICMRIDIFVIYVYFYNIMFFTLYTDKNGHRKIQIRILYVTINLDPHGFEVVRIVMI
jgi:hypothetical protein